MIWERLFCRSEVRGQKKENKSIEKSEIENSKQRSSVEHHLKTNKSEKFEIQYASARHHCRWFKNDL